MGGVAAVAPLDIVASFTGGFGTTMGTVGILIALGAMVGKLLADSGGSDTIVDTIIGKVGTRGLPWAMALIAAILGLPLFFEVGVVLLVPVVLLVARRLDIPVMRVGIPALAGLSILHGLVPPHPGPLVAIDARGRRPRPHAALRADRRRAHPGRVRPAAGPRSSSSGCRCTRPSRPRAVPRPARRPRATDPRRARAAGVPGFARGHASASRCRSR